MYLKDPKTGEPSVTLTVFVVGCAVCLFKLLVSGIIVADLTMSPFTGVDFGAAMAALGGVYIMRRKQDSKEE